MYLYSIVESQKRPLSVYILKAFQDQSWSVSDERSTDRDMFGGNDWVID